MPARQEKCDEILRIEESLNHGFFTSAGCAVLCGLLLFLLEAIKFLVFPEKTNRRADATT